jgi:hypothetical protein
MDSILFIIKIAYQDLRHTRLDSGNLLRGLAEGAKKKVQNSNVPIT